LIPGTVPSLPSDSDSVQTLDQLLYPLFSHTVYATASKYICINKIYIFDCFTLLVL
jgi:hypothetical protein